MISLSQGFDRLPPTTQHLLSQSDRLRQIEEALKREPRLPKSGYRLLSLQNDHQASGETLTILTKDSITTTRLKNLTPTILAILRPQDISKVSIKTQGEKDKISTGLTHITPSVRPISASTAQLLRKTAVDTPLGEALNRLVDQALIK